LGTGSFPEGSQARAARCSLSFVSIGFPLVREHFLQLSLIRVVGNNALAEFTLTGTRFRCQDVAGIRVTPGDFTRARLLETLRSSLVSF
jgi:hypothetical protein